MKCGNCKGDHATSRNVRECYAEAAGTAEVQLITQQAVADSREKRESWLRQAQEAKRQQHERWEREGFPGDDDADHLTEVDEREPELPSPPMKQRPFLRRIAESQLPVEPTEAQLQEIGLYEGTDEDTEKCGRCAGTGMFITHVMNGVPTGPGGPCFRCLGKGKQTDCGEQVHRERAIAVAKKQMGPEACCDRVRNDLYQRYGMRL